MANRDRLLQLRFADYRRFYHVVYSGVLAFGGGCDVVVTGLSCGLRGFGYFCGIIQRVCSRTGDADRFVQVFDLRNVAMSVGGRPHRKARLPVFVIVVFCYGIQRVGAEIVDSGSACHPVVADRFPYGIRIRAAGDDIGRVTGIVVLVGCLFAAYLFVLRIIHRFRMEFATLVVVRVRFPEYIVVKIYAVAYRIVFR